VQRHLGGELNLIPIHQEQSHGHPSKLV
jgi:hypothetical protein